MQADVEQAVDDWIAQIDPVGDKHVPRRADGQRGYRRRINDPVGDADDEDVLGRLDATREIVHMAVGERSLRSLRKARHVDDGTLVSSNDEKDLEVGDEDDGARDDESDEEAEEGRERVQEDDGGHLATELCPTAGHERQDGQCNPQRPDPADKGRLRPSRQHGPVVERSHDDGALEDRNEGQVPSGNRRKEDQCRVLDDENRRRKVRQTGPHEDGAETGHEKTVAEIRGTQRQHRHRRKVLHQLWTSDYYERHEDAYHDAEERD